MKVNQKQETILTYQQILDEEGVYRFTDDKVYPSKTRLVVIHSIGHTPNVLFCCAQDGEYTNIYMARNVLSNHRFIKTNETLNISFS